MFKDNAFKTDFTRKFKPESNLAETWSLGDKHLWKEVLIITGKDINVLKPNFAVTSKFTPLLTEDGSRRVDVNCTGYWS